MTAEQMRITTNIFRGIWSRLARSTADLVSKNGRFRAIFRTIVLKTQDDHRCVKWAFSMRAVLLPKRFAIKRMQTGVQ